MNLTPETEEVWAAIKNAIDRATAPAAVVAPYSATGGTYAVKLLLAASTPR